MLIRNKTTNNGPTVTEIVKFFRLRNGKEKILKYMNVPVVTKLTWLEEWRQSLVNLAKKNKKLADEISKADIR